MDIFTQKKILVRIVIILTVLNLLSMGLFLWKDFYKSPQRPQEKNRKEVSSVLERELKLDKQQVDQVSQLRSDYFEKEAALVKLIRSERDSLNIAMFRKNSNEEQIIELAKKVADNEFKMELLRYEQSKEFKLICTPAQLEKFEGLVLEIRDYFRPEKQSSDKKR